MLSAITNPLTSVPSASSISSSAARKGPTSPLADTDEICDVKGDSGPPSLSWPCGVLILSLKKKIKNQRNYIFMCNL